MANLLQSVKRDFVDPLVAFNQSNAFENKTPTVLPSGPMSRDIPAGPQSFANQSFGSPTARPVVTPAPVRTQVAAASAPVPAPVAPTPEELAARAQLEAERAASSTMTPEKQAQFDKLQAIASNQQATKELRDRKATKTPFQLAELKKIEEAKAREAERDRPVLTGAEGLADIPKPRSLEEIRDEQMNQAQAMIDATQGIFQQEIQRLEQQGQARLAQTSSILVGAGLAGSPFQLTGQEQSRQATNEILATRQAERRAEVAKIMAAAQDRATDIHDREITRFQQERRLKLDEDEAERLRLKSIATAAKESISNIAASGASLDDMDQSDYQNLLADSGLSDFEAKAYWAINSPEANATFSQQGDRFVGGYYDPSAGQFRTIISDAIPELAAIEDATLDIIDGIPYVISKDANGNLTGSILPGFQEPVEEVDTSAPKVQKFGENDYRQWNAQTGTWDPIVNADNVNPEELMQQQQQLSLINSAIAGAEQFAHAAGRSKWKEAIAQGIFGATDYTNLQAAANTIKTLVLTMAGDPNVKKFFGPQMSEADVRMMMAGGTTLDPELQGPVEFKAELQRVKEVVARMEAAVSEGFQAEAITVTQDEVDQLKELHPEWTDDYIREQLGEAESQPFNNDLNMSLNGSANVLDLGAITGYGSSLWKHGLDIDLKVGDPVPSPSAGKVVFVGTNGGFGKQVRIKTAQGNEVWLSHLDGFGVKKGQQIKKGQVIGRGGNTGKTIPLGGGDGSHLDLTVQRSDGSFYDPREIANLLA